MIGAPSDRVRDGGHIHLGICRIVVVILRIRRKKVLGSQGLFAFGRALFTDSIERSRILCYNYLSSIGEMIPTPAARSFLQSKTV